MNEFYEITGTELQELYSAMRFADKKLGLRKIRVYVDGDHLKFKVNEFVWSPPYGKKVKAN